MILVTVGTGLPFDALIESVDRAAYAEGLGEEVVFQTGHGRYQPANGRFFISLPSLRSMIRDASLVICHGGMTLFECLLLEKPFIAVPNPAVVDNHQLIFLRALSKRLPIVWTEDPASVPDLIRSHKLRPVTPSQEQALYADLIAYLSKVKRSGVRR